jgi:diguanylate cyclase (GGDEF)-like protein
VIELPQPLLLVLLVASVALGLGLGLALRGARGQLRGYQRRQAELETRAQKLEQLAGQSDTLRWITADFLHFTRQIHGPIRVREIPAVLEKFIGKTFDPTAGVILIRRKPALSQPGRENQLVVVSAPGTRIAVGSVIALGEGDLGYVAQSRRAMDRGELDQTPSAGGDAGALAGFRPDLAVPLAVGGTSLGVVGIAGIRRSRARSGELLDLTAQTAALALENSLVMHKIRTAASADSLTGIYNKGALLHRLDELIAEVDRTGGELAVFLFDLDHFKCYNDNNGRVAGDELLRLLTSLISDEVRVDDVFGRLGGEEFLLILPGRSAGEAEMTAEKVLRLVRGHRFDGAGGQPSGKITISGGVAVYRGHATGRSGLLQAADRARYRAKERGRDRALVASDLEGEAPARPAGGDEAASADDLQRITGIGPTFEQALHEVGISTFRAIAELNWTRMVLVASRLKTFPERIVKDRWLQQARELHRQKYGEKI